MNIISLHITYSILIELGIPNNNDLSRSHLRMKIRWLFPYVINTVSSMAKLWTLQKSWGS